MKRHIINKLKEWKAQKTRKPLILNGVRQCGKTYILEYFAKTHFSDYHYVNFEADGRLASLFTQDLHPQRIINELSFYLKHPIDLSQDLIIFDEIQACPHALASLKYFYETMPQIALCCAGSLLGIELNTSSFPVGKVESINMCPLNFTEFLQAIGEQQLYELLTAENLSNGIPEVAHQQLWEKMKWYWIIGGLPAVISAFIDKQDNLFLAFEAARALQKQLLHDYYADFAKHSGKVNAMHIDRLWRNIPKQLANTQDSSINKFKFKGIVPNIDRYSRLANVIDWLAAARLIIKIPIIETAELPLSAHVEESKFKLCLFDVGILSAMSDLPFQSILDYDFGTYKGYYAESFVAQELYTQDQTFYCWQKLHAEIEFVLQAGKHIIPVEVKSGSITRARSLQKFIERYQPPYAIIMSAQPLHIDHRHNTLHYPLYCASQMLMRCCAKL